MTKQLIQTQKVELIDNAVMSVLGSNCTGFEMAFKKASAIQQLKELLTDDYMAPIMAMQGTKIGFRTDRDKNGGYELQQVKMCLIEAVLTGVQPYGNQFNIIAGNMYVTKEGYGYLLSKIPGLKYTITPHLPRVKDTSSAIVMTIEWSINGGAKNEKQMDIPVRVNSGMGTDAIIGKAMRKARAWLFQTITGNDIGDGEVDTEEAEATVVSSTQITPAQSQFDIALQNLHTITEVQQWHMENPDCPESAVDARISELEKQANENAG